MGTRQQTEYFSQNYMQAKSWQIFPARFRLRNISQNVVIRIVNPIATICYQTWQYN